MRLVGLYIENYGLLHDLSITEGELCPGPCVIYGLNEAGKSTLLSFIRAVLFGFKGEGQGEPVRGGQNGGRLLLEEGGQVYRVERRGRGNGRVVVELPDGSRAGEELLRTKILRGVSPVLFKNIFALGMDELRKLEDLARDEVGAHIYGAGTGTGPQRLAEAAAWLDKNAAVLFKPRGKTPVLNRLLAELDGLDRQIRELEEQPERYNTMRGQLKELEIQKERLRAERDAGQKRLRRLDNLLKARAPWNELQRCLANRRPGKGPGAAAGSAGSMPPGQFPEEGAERLGRLEVRRDEKQAEVRALDKKLHALEAKLAAVQVDEKILARAAALEELAGERSLYLEKKQTLAELQARVGVGLRGLREKLASLGPGWDEDKIVRLDTSLAARRQVEDFNRRFRSLEQNILAGNGRLAGIRKEVAEKQAARDDCTAQLNDLSGLPVTGGRDPSQMLSMLEQAALELERQQHYQSLLGMRHNQLAEINDRIQRVKAQLGQLTGTKRPPWPLLVAVSLGFLGAGAAFYNIILGILILAGGIGLAVLFNTMLAGQTRERQCRAEELGSEAAALEKDRAVLEQELAGLEEELAAIAVSLRRAAMAVHGRETLVREDIPGLRQYLMKELDIMRRGRELAARLEQAGQALSRATGELRRLEEELAGQKEARQLLEHEWQRWLSHRGLPSLDTAGTADFLSLAESTADAVRSLQAERKTLEQVGIVVHGYEDRVINLAGELGEHRLPRDQVASYVGHLTDLLNEQRKADARRRRYIEELEDARESKNLALDNLAAVEQSIQELLALGGACDVEDFRKRLAAHREQLELGRRIDALQGQLLNIAGSAPELQELQEELNITTREQHESQNSSLEASLAVLEDELARLVDAVAALKQQMRVLENDEALARARQRRDMLRARLAARAREWQVTTLCAALLEMAREKHERERQPAVLARASVLIGPMTRGRYTRVVAPVGETAGLVVEDADGCRVPARRLSRGAAGQLYLAVRMALADHFGAVAAPMPIILDDILVDFDAGRLRGALQVIKEMAQKHQVIFFTCHDYILAAAREQLGDFSLVILENGVKATLAGL
ncbi:AAA family ATPase [Desulfoscipio gibsoniae]|uniref:YhaN AAA domain-containing protein n=1 Tax=Desulfoscipio gibsoniae DSM 7213 TaxID=767817 RepID=R4KKK3_9FIRM|nr:AAA family ATPase [Desulfoscipio gibsoniae]AGL00166.1 hypothetical protein Desgi_0606 [Desulfoscipio gibsoniae DSM 7213]